MINLILEYIYLQFDFMEIVEQKLRDSLHDLLKGTKAGCIDHIWPVRLQLTYITK